MDKFFEQYPYILFFIGCFFALLENRNSRKQINPNVIVIYILFALLSIFGVGSFLKNLIIILLLIFVELEILSAGDKKDILVVSAKYKLINFSFNLINKYKFVYIFFVNFFYKFSHDILADKNKVIWGLVISLLSILYLSIIGKIYECDFSTKEIEDIEADYEKAIKGYQDFISVPGNEKKLELLLEIEDKTFKHRKSSYTSFCWECLVYKVEHDYRKVDFVNNIDKNISKNRIIYIIKNLKSIVLLGYRAICVLINSVISGKGLKRYLNRGYSTIEMQLIRTYGIKTGYEKHTYLRKIYELLYANIFFKSYKRKTKHYNYLINEKDFKNRILYAYFKSVRTFINEKVFRNIGKYYEFLRGESIPSNNFNVLNELTIEELFIFILGLSKKEISYNILKDYSDLINKYNLKKYRLNSVIYKSLEV